ncbi:MAG: hypothetical protein U0233_07875 [Nitrospira sp.]
MIETADTAEASCNGYVGHREPGLVEQLLREKQTSGLGQDHRRHAQMLIEEPA